MESDFLNLDNGIDNGRLRKSKGTAFLLFLIGLFSQTQINIGGKLGISELVMVVFAPFVFLKNISMIKRDGCLYYFWLIILWFIGAVFVDVYTGNYIVFMMRGIAVPVTLFSCSVCIYVLLRKNFDNLKWILLGIAISGVISIFVFQRGVAGEIATESGMESGVEAVVNYKLFWVSQLKSWLTLPISGWYTKVPKGYSVIALIFLSTFSLLVGGRSASLVVAMSLVLIVLVGKSRQSILFLKRHMFAVMVLLLVGGGVMKFAYEYAVVHEYMGERELKKYEHSTSHGSGTLDLLMAGRGEFFIGLMAALDKPLMGHGSVAIDEHGYVLDFMSRYGTLEDYNQIVKMRENFGARIIPAHSHVINYWMWHGIGALIFWLCVIGLAVKTLFRRMGTYPPWFGYLAIMIPTFLWDVLFSPFGARVQESALFVVLLLIGSLQRR